MKDEHNLPLAHIRKILKDGDYKAKNIEIQFLTEFYGVDDRKESSQVSEETKARLDESGLSRMIERYQSGPNLEAMSLIGRGLAHGLKPEEFKEMEEIVERYAGLLHRIGFELFEVDEAADSMAKKFYERDWILLEYLVTRKNQKLQDILTTYFDQAETCLERVRLVNYVPSRSFVQKFRIEEQARQMEADPELTRDAANASRYVTLLELAGESGKALAWLDANGAGIASHPRLRLHRTVLLAFEGRLDEAIEEAKEVKGLDGVHEPIARAYLSCAYILKAAAEPGIHAPAAWARKVVHEAESIPFPENLPLFDALELRFVLGNMWALMPRLFGKIQTGITHLEAFLRMLSPAPDSVLPFQGARQILEIRASAVLGEAHDEMGEKEKAKACWSRIVLLDPHSDLASRVYRTRL